MGTEPNPPSVIDLRKFRRSLVEAVQMDPFFLITLEFGANGITSEITEYQEYERLTETEAVEFFDGAIADSESVGITGIRLEYFDADGFDIKRTWGTYNV